MIKSYYVIVLFGVIFSACSLRKQSNSRIITEGYYDLTNRSELSIPGIEVTGVIFDARTKVKMENCIVTCYSQNGEKNVVFSDSIGKFSVLANKGIMKIEFYEASYNLLVIDSLDISDSTRLSINVYLGSNVIW